MTQLTSKPTTFFKADPNQPRKQFDLSKLRALGESLKIRQNDPVQAKPDGTLIDGERRWRAADLVGLETLDVIITDAALTDTEVNVVRLTSFFHREDLTAFEKWNACKQQLELSPGWTARDLAETLHVDPSMVTRLLSPSKCIPSWQEALKEGKVGISDVYAASKLPESEQAGLLALKLSGASRDTIEKAGRKKRSVDEPVVKVNRVKCVLPSGVQIVVSGKGISMDESIDALAEAIKEMKRARDLGYTSKTFAAAMKDKANKA
jgi:ParB family chromosome partitioning protein